MTCVSSRLEKWVTKQYHYLACVISRLKKSVTKQHHYQTCVISSSENTVTKQYHSMTCVTSRLVKSVTKQYNSMTCVTSRLEKSVQLTVSLTDVLICSCWREGRAAAILDVRRCLVKVTERTVRLKLGQGQRGGKNRSPYYDFQQNGLLSKSF